MVTREETILCENTLQLYRDYVGMTDPQELLLHLQHVQSRLDKEGKVDYRCIKRYKFAFSRLYDRFFYQKILLMAQQAKEPYFLDVGCCTGTDLRKLLLDGYPRDYLIGMDVEQCYIDCGYELFKDNPTTCPIQFVGGDWEPTKTKMMIVHAGSVFHLFPDQETIQQFLTKITGMLRPGGVLIGGHVVSDQEILFRRKSTQQMKYYMGLEDFKKLLSAFGYKKIEIETKPRLGDDEEDFIAFWISFYAVYDPPL